MLASALIKLAEGRGTSEGEAPVPRVTALAPRGFAPLLISSLTDERWDDQLVLHPLAKGRTPRSLLLKVGLFLRGTREGACKSRLKAASLPPASAQQGPPPVLAWHPRFQKQSVGSSPDLHRTNKKSGQHLAKTAVRKKSFAKNFSLGSQFNGSRSLDLLLLYSGPFTDSIARPCIAPLRSAHRRDSEQVSPHSTWGRRPNPIPGVGTKSLLQLRLLLNGRHETQPIIEAVPTQIPSLLGGPQHRVNQAERPG
ncbi:hypothetical protein Cgig2_007483 [Carnegiea gigantea]|uniref:Uncharacterized protein n=1 Tax=Carnegiea gigantea TaxID=171969 RepID=A0A9Q1QDH8_9CARY|nr:hypothetical protein Cgig2_007483 [Carnegiea gigantea]